MLGSTNVSPSSGTEKIEEEHRIDNPFQARPYYFNMMYTAFIFRNYDHMKKSFKEYLKVKNPITSIYYAASVQTFYEGKICLFCVVGLASLISHLTSWHCTLVPHTHNDTGLVSFWLGRKENDKTWVERGKQVIQELEPLAKHSEWNYENKVLLLKAEAAFAGGEYEEAETLYDKAICSAKEHRFVNEEALGNELAAHFFRETGRIHEANICHSNAIETYNRWGATAKV